MGKYLEVVAGVKASGGSLLLIHHHSRRVVEANSIPRHVLEVIYTHLHNTRGPLAAPQWGPCRR